ncbi:hypothetical protein [Micromonospora sp. NPDC126480]|uniref:hypothetical protein n=1 Tax=Micromonospora sp. NPDC126480 TaxID=3155312 RepID=UPI003321096F
MQATVDSPMLGSRLVSALVWTQLLVVLAYGYGVVAYLLTDAPYFPEQAPPGWSWPAVVAVGVGFFPALLCLLAAVPALMSAQIRSARRQWRALAAVSAASVLMLLVMATPPGWALFDWYVS